MHARETNLSSYRNGGGCKKIPLKAYHGHKQPDHILFNVPVDSFVHSLSFQGWFRSILDTIICVFSNENNT